MSHRFILLDAPSSRGVYVCLLLQGHFGSELHGLCAHPSAPEFVTVGDDRMLRIWNIRDRKVRLTPTIAEN